MRSIFRKATVTGIVSFCAMSCAPSAVDIAPDEDVPAISLEYIRANFDTSAMVTEPKMVDCTLSDGTETQCFAITFGPSPKSQKIGPFCPRNIADGPDKSGIWIEGGKLYDADGAFIQGLSKFYDDPEFVLFDEKTGAIRVTDSKLACEAAARPDVAEEFRNYCVECEVSYVPEGTTLTYVIPIRPFPAAAIADRVSRGGVGIAFSGARLDAPAPTDAILAAHTLAPFDDCGGHVNPHVGYHLHAATNCLLDTGKKNGHGTTVGIALDGYPILADLRMMAKSRAIWTSAAAINPAIWGTIIMRTHRVRMPSCHAIRDRQAAHWIRRTRFATRQRRTAEDLPVVAGRLRAVSVPETRSSV